MQTSKNWSTSDLFDISACQGNFFEVEKLNKFPECGGGDVIHFNELAGGVFESTIELCLVFLANCSQHAFVRRNRFVVNFECDVPGFACLPAD